MVAALAAANAVTGCLGGGGGGGGGGATCASAVNHFYGQGCAFFDGDEMISRSEMISECEEAREDAPECGCKQELDRTVNCFQRVRSDEECESCNSEFEELIWCFEGC